MKEINLMIVVVKIKSYLLSIPLTVITIEVDKASNEFSTSSLIAADGL
jgi:hypothetical protein